MADFWSELGMLQTISIVSDTINKNIDTTANLIIIFLIIYILIYQFL